MDLPEIPEGKFELKVIDPKDQLIEEMKSHIKLLEDYNSFLKEQLELARARVIPQVNTPTPRPKFNTRSEIILALERHSAMQAERLKAVNKEGEKSEN